MELSAFGAVMKFAMDREEDITVVVKRIGSARGLASLKELMDRTVADVTKSMMLLERTRREHVNELILEPVTGLDGSNYDFKELPPGKLTVAEATRYLLGILDVIIRFYEDAAARTTNHEAARTFNRIAKAKMKLKETFEGYLSNLK